ncbi:hypothetical protein MLD63_01610 (plasmid) [Paracoccus sp. TK19116]|uniref:Secreted protein n=1 Tax=Paracoccus albicereus TaxID=2922394 RepID=A0ABT1MLS8_9RHOB|nr:hypothetical protein [Paracoccus albicereus]MCQ0969131.1 hypothetical protein [Paracoccus albicereus]
MFRISTATGIIAAAILSLPLHAQAQQADSPERSADTTTAPDDENAALRAELEAARAELEALKRQAPEGATAAPISTDTAPTDADDIPAIELAAGEPRDAALVAGVVADAPGAPTDPVLRTRLHDLLVQGVCAPDALAQVQDPINRQTLLALMTRLPRC